MIFFTQVFHRDAFAGTVVKMMAKNGNDDFLYAPKGMQNPMSVIGAEHFGAINQGVYRQIVFKRATTAFL
jgi:hypothetical protein